jgi:histidinol-phosphate aminotransferase
MFKDAIVTLDAYHPQKEVCDIVLDANESYVNQPYNRYPDPTAGELRAEIAKRHTLSMDNIIVGNGSSEMIDLIMKCTLSPGDKLLTFGPTFSIYELNATILGAETVTLALDESFRFDESIFIKEMLTLEPSLVILCNPNNPTGTLLTRSQIVRVLDASKSMVVLDEAYIEFGGDSVLDLIDAYSNLIVLRTLSKAYGLAGARVGYMASCVYNIQIVNKVRPPYNLSVMGQSVALEALRNGQELGQSVEDILHAKVEMTHRLKGLVRVYPGGGNFIFFSSDKEDLYQQLLARGIRIRQYSGGLKGYFRVTIGTPEENKVLLEAMEAIYE